MNKKMIKLVSATAVAASGFVAAMPHQTEAASSVVTTVDQAIVQMQKAYHTYSDVTAKGEFADLNAVYKQYNAAKTAYTNAKAVVNKSGGKQKDVLLAKLDSNYQEYIQKRVVTYIDAYNYAINNLEGYSLGMFHAIQEGNLENVQSYYHELSYQLNVRTVILDRVYGQTTRELFRSTYKADAKTIRDSVIHDVTIAMKAKEVQEAVAAGKIEQAAKAVEQLIKSLPKVSDKFKAVLTTAAEEAIAKLAAAQSQK